MIIDVLFSRAKSLIQVCKDVARHSVVDMEEC